MQVTQRAGTRIGLTGILIPIDKNTVPDVQRRLTSRDKPKILIGTASKKWSGQPAHSARESLHRALETARTQRSGEPARSARDSPHAALGRAYTEHSGELARSARESPACSARESSHGAIEKNQHEAIGTAYNIDRDNSIQRSGQPAYSARASPSACDRDGPTTMCCLHLPSSSTLLLNIPYEHLPLEKKGTLVLEKSGISIFLTCFLHLGVDVDCLWKIMI